jgi:hypothetical protein
VTCSGWTAATSLARCQNSSWLWEDSPIYLRVVDLVAASPDGFSDLEYYSVRNKWDIEHQTHVQVRMWQGVNSWQSDIVGKTPRTMIR